MQKDPMYYEPQFPIRHVMMTSAEYGQRFEYEQMDKEEDQ